MTFQVVTEDDNGLLSDCETGRILRTIEDFGLLTFLDDSVAPSSILALISPEDEIRATKGKEIVSFTTHTKQRLVYMSNAWSVSGDNAVDKIRQIESDIYRYAIGDKMPPYAASVAAVLLRSHMPTIGGRLLPLGHAWRNFAHLGVYGGPVTHTKTGATNGYIIDRNAAFLQAFNKPLPTTNCVPIEASKYSEVAELDCLVHCMVIVPDTYWPCLPYMQGYTIQWPMGCFVCVVTSLVLNQAIEQFGIEVVEVYDVLGFEMLPWGRPIYRQITAWPKHIQKPVSTRLWGLCAAKSRLTGRLAVEGKDEGRGVHWYDEHPVIWDYTERLWWEPASAIYNPVVSAYVCAENHCSMMGVIHSEGPARVVYTHSDAVWLTGTPDSIPAGWKLEARGRLSNPGTGVYLVEGPQAKLGHAGFQADSVHSWKVEVKERRVRPSTLSRVWDFRDNGGYYSDSKPIETWDECKETPYFIDPFNSAYFKAGGWLNAKGKAYASGTRKFIATEFDGLGY